MAAGPQAICKYHSPVKSCNYLIQFTLQLCCIFFLETPYSLVLLRKNSHSLDTISLFLALLHFLYRLIPVLSSSLSFALRRFFGCILASLPSSSSCASSFGWFLSSLDHCIVLNIILLLTIFLAFLFKAFFVHSLVILSCSALSSLLWRPANGVRRFMFFLVIRACKRRFYLQRNIK